MSVHQNNLPCSCIKYVCSSSLFMRCWCYSVNWLIWDFNHGAYDIWYVHDMHIYVTANEMKTTCLQVLLRFEANYPYTLWLKSMFTPALGWRTWRVAVKYMTSYLHACFWRIFWVNFNFLSLLRHKYLMWHTKFCCKVNKIKIR